MARIKKKMALAKDEASKLSKALDLISKATVLQEKACQN